MSRSTQAVGQIVSAITLAFLLSACSGTPTSTISAATAAPAPTVAPASAPADAPATSATSPADAPTTAAPPEAPATATSAPTAATDAPTVAAAESAALAKLNLNDASAEQFLTIPGVGNRMVREFMEYRPYTSILQFRREIGKYVDDTQVAAYEQYVFVPVDVNQADADTLKQIPGVDDSIAAGLIAGRPFASNAPFLTMLATYLTPEQARAAGAYLTTP